MELVLYGSFNCPYSYLASLRADALAATGSAQIDWRAVVHDHEVPPEGAQVSAELAEMLDRELEELNGLLTPGEDFPASRPSVQPNTTAAVAGYAATSDADADRLRRSLFSAYWARGEDIGDRQILERLGCPPARPGERMQLWEAEWNAMERRVVPMMVLPDGRVSRGLGTLARLAEMAGTSTPQ